MLKNDFKRTIELDGLRGAAVLMVLLLHAMQSGPNQTSGPVGESTKLLLDYGWSGVELFFVLSGFLITSLTLNGPAKESWVKSFYIKRFFRIVPALVVTLILIFAAAGYNSIGVHDGFDVLYDNFIYFILLSPNWLAVDLIGECQNFAQLSAEQQSVLARPCKSGWYPGTYYIGHLWTIGVEIHFYLLWPLFVLAMKRNIRNLMIATVSIIVLSIVARIVMWQFLDSEAIQGYDWGIIYTNTFSRLDSLFFGVFIALLIKSEVTAQKLSLIKKGAAAAFVIFIITSVVLDGRVSPFTPLVFIIGFSIISLFYACIVLHLYTYAGEGKGTSVFRLDWLRQIGHYSYAIYLVHHPIMFVLGPMFREHIGQGLIWQLVYMPVLLVICMILGKLFWELIEKPSMTYGNNYIKKSQNN